MNRPVKDLWWEDNDLVVVFADDGSKARFKNAYATSVHTDSEPTDDIQVIDLKLVKG